MIGAIIQARMGSTRLPGKIMLEGVGRPLLAHLVERLSFSTTLDTVVIATSNNHADDVIAGFCESRNISVFRGSESDVLDRYRQAAAQFRLTTIVRITSDCPLIDPTLLDEMVRFFLSHNDQYDLVTNRHPLTYPDGTDLDVMSFQGLESVWKNAAEPHQREHVIPFFWERNLRIYNFEHPDLLFNQHRWTLDYPEDYRLIKHILTALFREGELFTIKDILAYLALHPELSSINAKYLPHQ